MSRWMQGIACGLLALLWGPWFGAAPAAEQPPALEPLAESVSAAPRLFGLDLPAGPVVPGAGRCVLTRDSLGQPVVARVHVQVGQHLILLLPDGQLVTRSCEQCVLTADAFQPRTHEQILERLRVTQEFAGWRSRQTRHYLYLSNGSDEFAEIASRILETMFQGIGYYAQAQKITVHAPEIPLVVIIFPTLKQFHSHRSLPQGVTAYYDVVSNHVLLCEESELWQLEPELAIRQAIATIAHEGAHQILHNIGVQQRLSLWPMWLNEGLAEFFAATTTDRQLKWKGAGEVNDLRMYELEQLLKSRSAEVIEGRMVAQTIGAAKLTSTGYATAWALTHYLAKNQRETFHAFVREMSGRRPLECGGPIVAPGGIPANLRDFKRHFGEDLVDVERRLALHLLRLPYQYPFADWPHYVALLTVGDGTQRRCEADVFLERDQAQRWRKERLAMYGGPEQPAAEGDIREFPTRPLADQFLQQWLKVPTQ